MSPPATAGEPQATQPVSYRPGYSTGAHPYYGSYNYSVPAYWYSR
jgi:hypothetical protein